MKRIFLPIAILTAAFVFADYTGVQTSLEDSKTNENLYTVISSFRQSHFDEINDSYWIIYGTNTLYFNYPDYGWWSLSRKAPYSVETNMEVYADYGFAETNVFVSVVNRTYTTDRSKVLAYGDSGVSKYSYGGIAGERLAFLVAEGSQSTATNTPGAKYLEVDTTEDALYRLSVPGTGIVGSGVPVGSGVVVDMLVQFSPSDEMLPPNESLPDNQAKIGVWLYANKENGVTNLVVTAVGADSQYFTSTFTTNYFVGAAGLAVDPKAWHRLTILAVKDLVKNYRQKAGYNGRIGFLLYVDGIPLSSDGVDSGYSNKLPLIQSNLLDDVKAMYQEKRLFLSRSVINDAAGSIRAVGFWGVGKVDDLSIVAPSNGPAFLHSGN